jgi:hypothetical protein
MSHCQNMIAPTYTTAWTTGFVWYALASRSSASMPEPTTPPRETHATRPGGADV